MKAREASGGQKHQHCSILPAQVGTAASQLQPMPSVPLRRFSKERRSQGRAGALMSQFEPSPALGAFVLKDIVPTSKDWNSTG